MHRASASSANTKTPSESDTSSLNSIEMTEAAAAAAAMTGAAPTGPTRRHSSALLVNGKMGAVAGPAAAAAPAPPTGEFYKRTSAPNLGLPAGIPFDPDCQVTSFLPLEQFLNTAMGLGKLHNLSTDYPNFDFPLSAVELPTLFTGCSHLFSERNFGFRDHRHC